MSDSTARRTRPFVSRLLARVSAAASSAASEASVSSSQNPGLRERAAARGDEGSQSWRLRRPFGWRKDRVHANRREAAVIRAEVPRILAGVSALTLAQE